MLTDNLKAVVNPEHVDIDIDSRTLSISLLTSDHTAHSVLALHINP